MSSTTNNKIPKHKTAIYIRDDKAFVLKTKLSKTVITNITLLSTYNSDKPSNQHMLKLCQFMYKTRDITNFKTAKPALHLLTSNNGINKFQTLYTTIKNNTQKQKVKIKQHIKHQKDDSLENKHNTQHRKVVFKPDITITNKESEMPTYEVIL